MRLKSLFFVIPWSLISVLVLITWFSHLEFNERWLELICTFIFTSGVPIVFYLNSTRPRFSKTMLVLSFLLIIATTIVLRLKEFIHFGNGYVTQTVLYRKKSDPDVRIEFQMEDQGTLGTQMRTVKITPCFFSSRN